MITITTIEQVFAIYHVIKYQGALGTTVEETGGVRVEVLHSTLNIQNNQAGQL